MDNLDLGGDVSIRKRIADIIINGVWHDAILTDSQLILYNREEGAIHAKIPYSDIRTAVSGVNSLQEPVLTLTIQMPDGTERSEILVFVYQPAEKNIENLDSCIASLREQKVTIEGTAHRDAASRRIHSAAGGLNALDEEELDKNRRQVQGIPMFRTSGPARKRPPEGSEEKKILLTIGVVIIVILFFVGGAYLVSEMMKAKNVPSGSTGATGSAATPAKTATPKATAQPTPTPLPPPSEAAPLESGIWVRIAYPAYYTGFLSAGGWYMDVNSSGTQMFQIPVQETTINALLEKGDGSADLLTVEFYNGGNVIAQGNTTKPRGTIEMHVPVGAAIVKTPASTPAVQAAVTVPTPDSSVAQLIVPSLGTWVRVTYPGNFSGYIDANGYRREITGFGDQFYQLSLNHGTVEAFVEKPDGSANLLLLQVYKDGKLVTYASTTKPEGLAEIHTTV